MSCGSFAVAIGSEGSDAVDYHKAEEEDEDYNADDDADDGANGEDCIVRGRCY